jgi:hypothetical protein
MERNKMKKNKRVALSLVSVLTTMFVLAGISLLFPLVSVAGDMISEIRPVGTFHSLDFRGHGDLHITQGRDFMVRLEGGRDLLEKYETYVDNGRLVIEMKSWWKLWRAKSITAYITMPEVKGLTISGSGTIIGETRITSQRLTLKGSGSGDIDLEVDVKKLESKISGSGEIRLRGAAKDHEYQLSGSGDLKGYELATEKSTIKVSGSGKCEVSVSAQLDVRISGSGKVYYRGNPTTVNQKISGSGTIRKVE